MKRKLGLALMLAMVLAITTGCVSQGNFDELQDQYNELNSKYEELKSEYDSLTVDTADWAQLSEMRVATEVAQAEIDRLAAEEAGRIAAEEKTAAEEKAEAERKAAEDEALKENASLKDILIEPEKYDGQFVRITDNLVIVDNEVLSKEYKTFLSTGSKSYDYDTNFKLYVNYENMEDYKTWASVSSRNRTKISVAGTIRVKYNYSYLTVIMLDATEITLVTK